MNTCRAAVLTEFGSDLTIREISVPDPELGALLVRVDAATLCGRDIHLWQGALAANLPIEPPLIPGHERSRGSSRRSGRERILVVSGEIHLELDDGDVLLRAGDVVVQRGTAHSWSNRSGEPCIVFTVQVKSADGALAIARPVAAQG